MLSTMNRTIAPWMSKAAENMKDEANRPDSAPAECAADKAGGVLPPECAAHPTGQPCPTPQNDSHGISLPQTDPLAITQGN